MYDEGLKVANSGHSRYKENPACAGFLNGDFRPQLALPGRSAKGNYAATLDIHIFIVMFF